MGTGDSGEYTAALAAYLRSAKGCETSGKTARALARLDPDTHTGWTPGSGLEGVHLLRTALDAAYACAAPLRPLVPTRRIVLEHRLFAAR